ncbi:hypothetical protein Dimus_035450 [Dionaea muscipula]
MVDASCGGSVLTKNENDVWKLFETMSEASQYQASFERREKVNTNVARGVNEVQTSNDTVLRDISEKLELLLKKDAATSQVVYNVEPCVTCGSPAHHYSVCPTTQPAPRLAQEQVNAAYGFYNAQNPYNPGWRGQSNFTWKTQQPQNFANQNVPAAPP